VSIANHSRILFLIFALSFCCANWSYCQSRDHNADAPSFGKRGLHATLRAQPGYYGDPKLETLTFRLMNDSDQALDSSTSSWTW
jgi:hypothetical protein